MSTEKGVFDSILIVGSPLGATRDVQHVESFRDCHKCMARPNARLVALPFVRE